MRIGAMWTANPDRFPRNSRLVDLGFCDLSEKWDEQVSWFGETNAMKSHRNTFHYRNRAQTRTRRLPRLTQQRTLHRDSLPPLR